MAATPSTSKYIQLGAPAPITRGKDFSEIRIAKNGAPYLYNSLQYTFTELYQRAIRSAFIFQSSKGVYTHNILLKMATARPGGVYTEPNYRILSQIETLRIRVNLNKGSVYIKPNHYSTLALASVRPPTGMNHLEFRDSLIAMAQIADEEIATYEAEQAFARLAANFERFKAAIG